MAEAFDEIDDRIAGFIERQHVFSVATAPTSTEGLVNVSPKGLDSFRIIDTTTVAYLDLTGSGVETISHVRDNGRICVMFCAFDGPARIVRLHGRGTVVERDEPDFAELYALFPHVTTPGSHSNRRRPRRDILRLRRPAARIPERPRRSRPLLGPPGQERGRVPAGEEPSEPRRASGLRRLSASLRLRLPGRQGDEQAAVLVVRREEVCRHKALRAGAHRDRQRLVESPHAPLHCERSGVVTVHCPHAERARKLLTQEILLAVAAELENPAADREDPQFRVTDDKTGVGPG